MRRIGHLAVLIVLMCSLLPASCVAATLVVNTLDDATTPGDGLVTLREAITAANNDTATDLGQVGSGADTIYLLGLLGKISLSSALPTLTSDMTILGPGATMLNIQRSTAGGTPDFGVIENTSVTVHLIGLTISNGTAPGVSGGGIYNNGTMTVDRCIITGNSGSAGAGIENRRDLTLRDSTISNNTSTVFGAGCDTLASSAAATTLI